MDTLPIAQALFPELGDYTQPALYRHLFGTAALHQHQALGDVRALRCICGHPEFAEALHAAAASRAHMLDDAAWIDMTKSLVSPR